MEIHSDSAICVESEGNSNMSGDSGNSFEGNGNMSGDSGGSFAPRRKGGFHL